MRKAIWSNSGIVLKNAESLQIEIARWGLQFLKDPPCKGTWVPFWVFWVLTAMSALSCKTHNTLSKFNTFQQSTLKCKTRQEKTRIHEHPFARAHYWFRVMNVPWGQILFHDKWFSYTWWCEHREFLLSIYKVIKSSNEVCLATHYLSFNSASRFSICNPFKLTSVIIQIQS